MKWFKKSSNMNHRKIKKNIRFPGQSTRDKAQKDLDFGNIFEISICASFISSNCHISRCVLVVFQTCFFKAWHYHAKWTTLMQAQEVADDFDPDLEWQGGPGVLWRQKLMAKDFATMFSMQRVFLKPLQFYLFLQGQRIHPYSQRNHEWWRLSQKLKLIRHASIHPVYFGEFSFPPTYGHMSRNHSFCRSRCLHWT